MAGTVPHRLLSQWITEKPANHCLAVRQELPWLYHERCGKSKHIQNKLVFFADGKIEEMNIQTRKLNLFLRITDESIIEKLESFIRTEKKKQYDRDLKPMSLKEFHEMIDQAKQDKADGRVVSHEELKMSVKSLK